LEQASVAVLPRGFVATPVERLGTVANYITCVRTVASVALTLSAAEQQSMRLLLAGLLVYWVGDVADGGVARRMGQETRMGASFDIICDRLCAGCFYIGLVWLEPDFLVPVGIYLLEFMVVDTFLSLAFLAWPIISPNYFFLVDHRLWLWNWSKVGKAVNSAAFAVLLIATHAVLAATIVAVCLLLLKIASVVRLSRIGLPVPLGGGGG